MRIKQTVIFLLSITITACKSKELDSSSKNIIISLLNDSIIIPSSDSIDCIDTLFFHFNNQTNYEFIFAIPETGIKFNSSMFDIDSITFYSDPFQGVAARFLDGENNVLPIEGVSVFNHTALDTIVSFFPIDDVITIDPKSELIFKMLLKFPSLVFHHQYKQYVNDLGDAKYIELLFMPEYNLFPLYVKENDIKFDRNTKILKTRIKFKVPVAIGCD